MARGWAFALLLALAPGVGGACEYGLTLNVLLSRPVPFRVELTNEGLRLVVTARQPNAPELAQGNLQDPCVDVVAPVQAEEGWGAVGIDLTTAHRLRTAGLDGRAVVLELEPVPTNADTTLPPPGADAGLPLIVIDPGHGGIDAGAVREGLEEAELMLSFARELAASLNATGQIRALLSRGDDSYLSLGERVSFARNAEADAFLSLHADALVEGTAKGAAVFTLSAEASDAATAELVQLHDRADLLVGQDLGTLGDSLTGVLLDLARREATPRSRALAEALVTALAEIPGALRKEALRQGDFAVLKAADMPSVLVELGFMSDARDLENLTDEAWRNDAVAALTRGLLAWTASADGLATQGRK